ncbi:hypothetical protein ACHQM5_022605 [Ranunculus cassubicifolius]
MSLNPSAVMDDDASSSSGDDVNNANGSNKRRSTTSLNSTRRKRNRKTPSDVIVEAMLEIAAASKLRANAVMRNDDRFSISTCVKVLDEIHGLDQRIYYAALDLFENPNARETFISLKGEKRVIWLQGKCSASLTSMG